jgi:hypothetical protein
MNLSEKESVIVVGTIRNVEKSINSEINKLINALKRFNSVYFYLVESDSTDNTILILEKLQNNIPNFEFRSLGKLEGSIPDRLERIRFCRNEYVKYLRNKKFSEKCAFVMVADLDGMNSALKSSAIDSCFSRNDWDVVVSNQTFGYYDISALRLKSWQEHDWTDKYEQEKYSLIKPKSNLWINRIRYYFALDKIKYTVLYSKMIRLRKTSPWIQVDSGFGGAALYRVDIFMKHDYTKEIENNEIDHVSLHRKLIREGGKIYINPKFINSHINTYNLSKFKLIRILRNIIWRNSHIYSSKIYKVLKNIFKFF